MRTVLFIISVIPIIVAIVISVFFRLNKKISLSHVFFIVGIGFVFADAIFLFTLYDQSQRKNVCNIAIIIINAIKMASFSAPYEELLNSVHSINGNSGIIFFVVLTILTPCAWAGFVLLLFSTARNLFRYHFFRFFKPVCFFSELNENSLMMAKDLIEKDGLKKQIKYLCVFCGVNKYADSSLIEEAELYRLAYFSKPIFRFIKKGSQRHKCKFFAISENQDENLAVTKTLLEEYNKKYPKGNCHVHFYLYSEQKEAPLILANLKKDYHVSIINRNRYIANDLIFRHPVFEVIKNKEDGISALVIGAGKIGMQLVKNILWSGQLGNDYKLKITVFDKNAKNIEEAFYFECPQIEKKGSLKKQGNKDFSYDIDFIQVNFLTENFKKQIEKITPEPNYICICLGDDELNIRVALWLRRHFMRNGNPDNYPFIVVESKNDIKAAGVFELWEIDKKPIPAENSENRLEEKEPLKYHFHSFANNKTIYSRQVVEDELEDLAFCIHYAYECTRADMLKEVTPTETVAEKTYYINESNSSRARALHIPAKLFLAGFSIEYIKKLENIKARWQTLSKEISNRFKDKELVVKLAKIEHARWVAYMCCEGWIKAESKDINTKKPLYRQTRERRHYCIRSWEELESSVDKVRPNIDFKLYDEHIVCETPRILQKTIEKSLDKSLKKKHKGKK